MDARGFCAAPPEGLAQFPGSSVAMNDALAISNALSDENQHASIALLKTGGAVPRLIADAD